MAGVFCRCRYASNHSHEMAKTLSTAFVGWSAPPYRTSLNDAGELERRLRKSASYDSASRAFVSISSQFTRVFACLPSVCAPFFAGVPLPATRSSRHALSRSFSRRPDDRRHERMLFDMRARCYVPQREGTRLREYIDILRRRYPVHD